MTNDHQLTRRDALKTLTGLGILSLTTGSATAQEFQPDYQTAALLYGQERPDSSFFQDKTQGAWIHESPSGVRSAATVQNPNWQYLNAPNTTTITQPSDLPDPNSNGLSTLKPDTRYQIAGSIDIQNHGIDTLDINGATLTGHHAGVDTLLTTGTSPLLQTRGTNAFISRLALSAPTAPIFDLDAQDDAASLEEKQKFLIDTSVITNTPNMGTIKGYRAQSIKGCAFDTYDQGLTHDGITQKVLYDGVFIINVSDGNSAIIFEDASTFNTDVVDIAGSYFLGLNDTNTVLEVINGPADGGTNPVQVSADYVRNFHDDAISVDNILSGITTETLRWQFESSSPLSDSYVSGNMRLDPSGAPYTTTISTQDTWTQLNAVTVTDSSSRLSQTNDNEFTYQQTRTELTTIDVKSSLSAANTTIAIGIAVNGTVLDQSVMDYELSGSGSPNPTPAMANVELSAGDSISIFVKDTEGTNDITAHSMNVLVKAA